MRITAGQYRGRVLTAPEGQDVRPTADKVRQAVFNKLYSLGLPQDDTVVMDVFCGTGALGLEALSRGAAFCVFVDKAAALCRTNIAALGAEGQSLIVQRDARELGNRPPAQGAAQLVFMDPPYRQNLVPQTMALLAQGGWLAPGAVIVAETERDAGPDAPAGFMLRDERVYGTTCVRFYQGS